jgi:hypothetical protein
LKVIEQARGEQDNDNSQDPASAFWGDRYFMQGCAAIVTDVRLNGIFNAALRTVNDIFVVGCVRIHDPISQKSSYLWHG